MLKFKLKQLIAEREFKTRRQITLLEIAKETGINRMTLSKIANHPGAGINSENIDRLCRYFGCRIEDLVEYVADEG